MATKKKKKGKIVALVLILLLLVAFIAGFAFVKGKLNLINYDDGKKEYETIQEGDEDQIDLDLSGLEQVDPEGVPSGEIYKDENVLNVLILGTDERTKDFSENARSDSMMLLSINKKDHTAKLVSLERGMGVPILEGPYKGQYDWLTHTFRYGGADLMMREIQECFKVEVNRYVRVNLSTFIDGIDAIGGIDIELTQAEADYINHPQGTYAEYHIAEMKIKDEVQQVKAGMNHLNGATAMLYARCRYIDSDWGRVKRQQKVIQAAVNQVKNLSISEMNNMLNVILPLVQTNLKESEISGLLLSAPQFLGAQIESKTLPETGTYGSMTGMGGRKLFAADFEKNSEILYEFIY